jgi:hypothetical protein
MDVVVDLEWRTMELGLPPEAWAMLAQTALEADTSVGKEG